MRAELFRPAALVAGLILSFAGASRAAIANDFVGPPARTFHGCPANEVFTTEVVSRATGIPVEHIVLTMKFRYLSLTDFCTMPLKLRDRAILRSLKPKPDSPGEWARQRRQDQADENGEVKPDGLTIALEHRRNMGRGPKASPIEPIAGIRTSDWVALGPWNIGGPTPSLSPYPGK